MDRPLTILLIEDHLAEARFLQEILKNSPIDSFQVVHAKRLQEAIDHLSPHPPDAHLPSDSPQAPFDIILLDLTLPDSQGLASLDLLMQQAPNLPIVVLTNTNDNQLAIEALRQGAQDYLVKRQVNTEVLVRSLRYAIERKQISEALREANEALEVRVEERTAELAATNALLKQEIQSRRQVQERLELAQQAGKIGTFEWQLRSNSLTWSAELEALYGLEPGSFGDQYEPWIEMLHPDDRLKTEQDIWRAIHEGTELNTEFRSLWPNGETHWIAAKGTVFLDNLGKPLRMIGLHLDITERKQLEAQFLRAQRLESIGTLASGIAHDLNNILTPILAVAQLLPLKLGQLSEPNQHLVNMLEISARRGADLVKQILAFARGVEGNRIPLHLGHLLLEVEKIIRQTFPKSIEISSQVSPDLWLISADVTQIHQVLMNLCVNARDAMPHGGKLTLTVENLLMDEPYARTYLEAKVGSYVVIGITDKGSGIPPEIINRIFDPFFTTKEIGQGTGLGLSAVIGIVKSHGGFVDVQSQVGQGTAFKVFLPSSQVMSAQVTPELEPLVGQGELILVVDDEAAIREITKTTLETYHYRVLTAADGIDAIALYAQHQAEIQTVLIDMMMPLMDGAATIPMLRRLNAEVPVVIMSGLNSGDPLGWSDRVGIQGFLRKPFTTQELLQTLHRIRLQPINC